MAGKILLVALLAFMLGQAAFASEDEGATVTVKGRLHEDKFGFFVQANGSIYDLVFAENAKADMHKFHSELKDDYVQVTGSLFVDNTDKAKPRLTVYTNDITRFKWPWWPSAAKSWNRRPSSCAKNTSSIVGTASTSPAFTFTGKSTRRIFILGRRKYGADDGFTVRANVPPLGPIGRPKAELLI